VGLSTAQHDVRWNISPLRGVTYFLALLVVSLGALLAWVASGFPLVTRVSVVVFGLAIAAILVLLVRRPLSWLTLASTLCLFLAFVLPGLLIRPTPDTTVCLRLTGPPPCDPPMNSHLGLHVGLTALLFGLSLFLAVTGSTRPSRPR
jgi:hypothetical protein